MEIILPNDMGNLEPNGGSSHCIESPFYLNAEDFLKFAEEDIEGTKDKDIINALGNVKRAIENRVDLLHYVFGFIDLKGNGNFPTKLERLNNLGVVAPRILRKINKIRNLLEHQYELPKKEEVEDAIDIGILFIEYTNRFIHHFLFEFGGNCGDDDLSINFEGDKIKIIVSGPNHEDKIFSLTNKDSDFYDWVKVVTKNGY